MKRKKIYKAFMGHEQRFHNHHASSQPHPHNNDDDDGDNVEWYFTR